MGLNLHQVVRGAINSVNPDQPVFVQVSAGYTVDAAAGYIQVPVYRRVVTAMAQIQALTTQDLRQLEQMNIQGSSRTMYLNGSVKAIQRVTEQGGDIITMRDGTIWLTTAVLERWDVGWCKVAVTMQNEEAT